MRLNKIENKVKFWVVVATKIAGATFIIYSLVNSLINSSPLLSRGIDPVLELNPVKYVAVFVLYSVIGILIFILIYRDFSSLIKRLKTKCKSGTKRK